MGGIMKKILLSILLLFMNVMVVQAYTINDLYEIYIY